MAEDTLRAAGGFEMPWGNYLLKELVETPAPEAISWLPQTYGWLVLLMALAGFMGYRLYRAYRLYLANAYRREALAYLEKISSQQRWAQLPTLLKKVALQGYGRSEVASLSGPRWEQWLDSVCPSCDFRITCPGLLAQIAYQDCQSLSEPEAQQLLAQTSLWIRGHLSKAQLAAQEIKDD